MEDKEERTNSDSLEQSERNYFGNPIENKWKTDKGVWITLGLFYELSGQNKERAIYTIYDEDRTVDDITYLSLKKKYLEMEHVPGYEYDFANMYLGGWNHWLRLQKASKQLINLIQEWKDELEIKLRARSARAIINTSFDESPTAFHANKWINDKGWMPSKGRPKKADIQREAKIAAGVEAEISSDLERIRLVK